MSLTRWFALVLGVALLAPTPAHAKKGDDDEEEASEDESESEEASSDEEPVEDDEEKPKKKKKKAEDEEAEENDDEFVKQNLSGHDNGTKKKKNEFEKDRFFADKVDSEKTEKGTLVQGSLQSSTLAYRETGGNYTGTEQGINNARFSRLYTELRLQTDFRHLSASRWDARIDARARVIANPSNAAGPGSTLMGQQSSDDTNRIQSGFNGTNEYDLRELWLFRSGKRSDIFLGRQFVSDLGGVKFDGLRVDYANSEKFTLIGFGGLYPYRGSRSITTDYTELRATPGGDPAGRFVGTGGFGAAYRSESAYGAFGGVVLAPLKGEQPRVFATSTGYYRRSALLDLYHFALVDLYGKQGAGITNLSLGVNIKPSQRLRLNAAFNRVDVDTLAVQANAFLSSTQQPLGLIDNETFFRRLATNSLRAGVSAGLGQLQRFEVSLYGAYRQRGDVAVPYVAVDPNDATKTVTMTTTLPGTKGAEFGGSFVDRRSFKDMRLGIDILRTISLGSEPSVAYQRSVLQGGRVFAARELANGHGEWEAELSYTQTKDSSVGTMCLPGSVDIVRCYGSSKGTIIQAGGNLYYRINRDWFVLGTLQITRQTLTSAGNGQPGDLVGADPTIYGATLFGRAAYRF